MRDSQPTARTQGHARRRRYAKSAILRKRYAVWSDPRLGLLALTILLGASTATLTAQPSEPTHSGWIRLFNGIDLDGWIPKIQGYPAGENYGNTFRVEKGLLKVRYDHYREFNDRFGHLFYKESFSHYRLRVEYRFVGQQAAGGPAWAFRNSGLMLHGERSEQMQIDQPFPTSIEVQLLGGDGSKERATANLCTPGTNVEMSGELVTRHCIESSSRTFHGNDWVTVEVEVLGGRVVRHFVNGEPVLQYQAPQLDPRDPYARKLDVGPRRLTAGTISLQSESHPVDFRRVELLPLEPSTIRLDGHRTPVPLVP